MEDVRDTTSRHEIPEEWVQKINMDKIRLDKQYGYIKIWIRYASFFDRIMILLAIISSIISGAALPLMIFAEYINAPYDPGRYTSTKNHYVLYFVYIAIGTFVSTFLGVALFTLTGDRITRKIRYRYFSALLSQKITFYDQITSGELIHSLSTDMSNIQDGISEKIGLAISAAANIISAFVIAFIRSWKLTLILLPMFPAIIFVIGASSSKMAKEAMLAQAAAAKGTSLASEAIAGIRSTKAYRIEERLMDIFKQHLSIATKHGLKKQSADAIQYGWMFFVIYSAYALAFWEGSRLLVKGEVNSGDVITVFFALMTGAFAIGNLAPHFSAFSQAISSGSKVLNIIDLNNVDDTRRNSSSLTTSIPLDQAIVFDNVSFVYPTRPDQITLSNFSFSFKSGETTAIVGPSGSGKSTLVSLLLRFYSPTEGSINIGKCKLEDFDLQSLRSNIGYVQQNPSLFEGTIFENVINGLRTEFRNNSSKEQLMELVKTACLLAHASDFVQSLPDKYETQVGQAGLQLSGGQKQRLCIARAIISNPKILILDEATSNLDAQSEAAVQLALEQAAIDRTTIVIAHRLSTIQAADTILVMKDGQIVESGRHWDLIRNKGLYKQLIDSQIVNNEAQDDIINTPAENRSFPMPPKMLKKKSSQFLKIMFSRESLRKAITKQSSQNLRAKFSMTSINDKRFEKDIQSNIDEKQDESSVSEEEAIAIETGTLRLILKVLKFNKSEYFLMLIALFAAIICGSVYPAQSLIYAHLIEILNYTDFGRLRSQANLFSLFWFIIAIALLFAFWTFSAFFGFAAEKMAYRVRISLLSMLLIQSVEYFDHADHSTGRLTSILANDATTLSGLSGSTLGTLVLLITCLVGSLILALIVGWKLAVVTLCCIPLIVYFGVLRFKLLGNYYRDMKHAYEYSASQAAEAISAIKTVHALNREYDLQSIFKRTLKSSEKFMIISNIETTVLFAFSQTVTFLAYGLAFWYGGNLIRDREYTLQQFFICLIAIIFSSLAGATYFSFAPDMTKAKISAQSIFKILENPSKVEDGGLHLPISKGQVIFENVDFTYPQRSNQQVLSRLSIRAEKGKFVGIVGRSGSGKSTLFSLLEKFYLPDRGRIYIDSVDIQSIGTDILRDAIAYVPQDCVIYNGTIQFNILLGVSDIDKDRDYTDEVEEACKCANIHDFISGLPEGYETIIGQNGSQLSGGQRQRIALARALIRKPKILLLDESTSALDSESERLIQDALEKAAHGRTTIVIAHRLSTVVKADVIYVINKGSVAEHGTHSDLFRKRGIYWELVKQQEIGANKIDLK